MAGFVEVGLTEGRIQGRDALGQFTSEVERACDGAAQTAAVQGASEAEAIYGGRYQWRINFHADGGGGEWNIVASGQWAEAAEFGIPPHPITPHDPTTHLYNPTEDFGPIYPAGAGVMHSGTDELRMVETAGDIVAHEFEGLLVSYLP